MKIHVRSTPLGRHRDEAVVLLVAQEDPRRMVVASGPAFGEAWDNVRKAEAFTGEAGCVRVLYGPGKERIPTLVVVGRGGGDGDIGTEHLRQAASAGARAARDAGARSVTVVVPSGRGAWLRADRATQAVTEGAVMGLYRFEAHKTEKEKTAIESLTLLAPRGEGARAQKGAEAGRAVGEAVALARDLGNQPGNHATPTWLADTAQRIAAEQGLKVRILEEDDMRRLGMGALLGVTKGSAEPAKLIVLVYEPRRRGRTDTVALVGKGLTFDSGGISIKPSAKMEDMKFDMCGGAAVLATMQAVTALRVPVRVVGLIPASENMPDGAAFRPGDVLRAMNGVTIEIRNTDAEGRLILADALAYASTKLRPRPKAIVDLATLTGACVVALGNQCAALMSNDDRLAACIADAGGASGDDVWRLPLKPGYRKQLESPYADTSNLGTPGAGSITAGVFLEKFTGRIPWAHLDIAGMAWTTEREGYGTTGATGFGVRLLCRLLCDWNR